MTTRGAVVAVPFAAALGGAALLHVVAPRYLFGQGFPLDDAWIHAVYARELARTGMLAYNPGVPATGETSPLWALIIALPQLSGSPAIAVAGTKGIGFALHAAAALTLALLVSRLDGSAPWMPLAVGGLVGVHPDLVAASVSGMEVPLAAAIVALTAWITPGPESRRKYLRFAVAGAVAFLARPETAIVPIILPLVYWLRDRPGTALRCAGAACAGALVSVAAVSVRNLAVSAMPLPATFYVKARIGNPVELAWQRVGFTQLLGGMPLVSVGAILAVAVLVSVVVIARPGHTASGRMGAALYFSGVVFCAISFALVPPLDPYAFYHQRYVLPAVFAMVAALPLMTGELLRGMRALPATRLTGALAAAMILVALAGGPARYRRLANDARNIDDVQVAMGRALSTASPADNAWVIDAGASRYFGRAFVVDLVALNTFELLTPAAQSFLDSHPPSYLDAFQEWSEIRFDDGGRPAQRRFAASTEYTVTSFGYMRQHALISCEPPGRRGTIVVRKRAFAFQCQRSRATDQ